MLGLVATGKRSIRSGDQYDALFDIKSEGKEVQLLADGDVHDTIRLMKRIVSQTLAQTKGIAQHLKGSSRAETARNVWNFCYHHIQYKKDHPLREQLRTPSRTWRDRKKGVDCDCYAILISSILTNLSVPHGFRMAGYKGDFQHVYVIVPKSGTQVSGGRDSYIVVDPVVDKFNYEEPFNKKSDSMSQVTMLNGVAGLGQCADSRSLITTYVPTQQIIAGGGVPTREFLEANGIEFAPVYDESENKPMYAVCLASGLKLLPPVISREQSQELKAAAAAPAPTQSATQSTPLISDELKAKAKKNWLWIAAIIAGSWILLTGSDQKEVSPGLSGLNGTPGRKAKGKKKHAVKAISI